MPDNVINSLQIEIESTTKTAATSLSQFQAALKKLDALGNGTGIKNLYKSLKSLEKINLSKLTSQLTKIFDAAKKPIEIKTKVISSSVSGGTTPKAKTVTNTSGNIDTTEIARTSDVVTSSTERIGSMAAVAARSFDHLNDPIKRVKAEIDNYLIKIRELTNEYNKLNNNKGDVASLLSLEKQIISSYDSVDRLQSKLAEMSNVAPPPTSEIVKFGRELEKAAQSAAVATSGGNKFFNSIKRIAMYRLIRTALKEISQAFIQGMQNYVQYSQETNQTISNLLNTENQLKNTLGVTFVGILTALEPLITSLADGIIKIVNNINALFAAMNGQETFSKAKKGADSYADSLKKVNSQLFSFDKFEALSANSSGANFADMFEKVSVDAELGEWAVDVDNLKKAFEGLGGIFVSLGGLAKSLFNPILSIAGALAPAFATMTRAITPAISGIAKFLGWVIEGLDKIGALIPILSALGITLLTLKFLQVRDQAMQFNIAIDEQKLKAHLAKMELDSLKVATNGKATADVTAAQMAYNHEKAMLNQMKTTRALNTAMAGLQAIMSATALGATIGDLVSNWGEMSTAQKISQISTIALTAAMTALAIANVAAQSGLGAVVAVPLAVLAIGAGIASAVAAAQSAKIPAAAQGGSFSQGQLFIANEAGPELVASIGGRSAVANNDMIVSAIRQAAYEGIVAGLSQSDLGGGSSGEAVFNLDGRTFARAVYPHIKAEQRRSGG